MADEHDEQAARDGTERHDRVFLRPDDPMAQGARATADTFRRRKAKTDQYVFPLVHTSKEHGEDITALVYRIDPTSGAWLSRLPGHLQGETVAAVQAIEARGLIERNPGTLSQGETEDAWSAFMTMADGLCIASFVEPRLYATESEADRENGVWIGNIHHLDRRDYAVAVVGDRAEVAALLTPFPDRPAPAPRAASRRPAVSAVPRPVAEPKPRPARRRDRA